MPDHFLKIIAYGLAWISPVLIFIGVSRSLGGSEAFEIRRKLILLMLIPLTWLIGLSGSFLGHYFHERAWMADHPLGAVTEEDMLALGDYPNVAAGWLLLGWIPVMLGFFLRSKR